MSRVAALLLAGGQSTRMGRNKAFLDYQGTALWRLQMDKLLRLQPDQLFFSVQPAMELPPGPWTFVYDRLPHLGPLGGLEAALRLTGEGFLITLAVDMPAMTSDFLSLLLRKAGPRGIVPHLDGFYHGASAVYPASILPLFEQILASNDRSFQHLVREALKIGLMEVEEIQPEDASLFRNWNSPQDLKWSYSASAR
jgi:molybdopterin-guanine dinucleotide biosynthesis protein A